VDDVRTKTLAQERATLAGQIAQQKQTQAFQDFLKKVLAHARIVVNPRYGDFNAKTLQIDTHEFFVPPTPEPQTQAFPTQ
jgi:hypothetical protein